MFFNLFSDPADNALRLPFSELVPCVVEYGTDNPADEQRKEQGIRVSVWPVNA